MRTIRNGLESLKDGDFSISLQATKDNCFNHDIDLFNTVIDRLRNERQYLFQRELLLDKVVNASNVVTLLINTRQDVVFSNLAAKHFFGERDDLIGADIMELTKHSLSPLRPYLKNAQQGIQDTVLYLEDQDGLSQAWHLTSSIVKLHHIQHALILIKPISEQLNRQELQTWKKVVRVINHELNNSLAPISSLCHSGQLISNQLHNEQLERVFSGISRRVNHLTEFVKDYSELAKIKEPNKQKLEAEAFFTDLQQFYNFNLEIKHDVQHIFADQKQLTQVLINLLKNAWQAEAVSQVIVKLTQLNQQLYIEVCDNGIGMDKSTMQNAFTPYFSTKQQGSGIGLAICRDIIEAHNGRIQLTNQAQRGLKVSISLPF